VQLLMTIDRLVHSEGYTLRGARQVIESGEVKPEGVASVAARPVAAKEAPAPAWPVAELRAIRDTLAAALAAS
jgi:hypothetical protein